MSASNSYGRVEQHYRYDRLGRLSSVTSPDRPDLNESYQYDASGNISEKVLGGRVVRMHYDTTNQITSRTCDEGERTFTYDAAGRMIEESLNGDVVVSYSYGYLDKVVAVASGGNRTDFYYNASGMLVGKQKAGSRIEPWQWNGLELVARGDNVYAGEPHIAGSSALISRSVSSGGQRTLLSDYLGTTLAAFDSDGSWSDPQPVRAASYVRTSFGAGEGTPADSARFTGKPYDADLGAVVFPYRNYRPDLGRWMSADPINFPDGPNQHFYAPVPTTGVDPLGLQRVLIPINKSYSRNMIQRQEYRVTSATITASTEVTVGTTTTFGGGLELGVSPIQIQGQIATNLGLSLGFSYSVSRSWLDIGNKYPNYAFTRDHPSSFNLNTHIAAQNLGSKGSFDGWEIQLPQDHTDMGAHGSPWTEDPIPDDGIKFQLQTHNFSWHASYWMIEN